MRGMVVIVLVSLSLWAAPSAARACKPRGPIPFELTGKDSGPPGRVTFLRVQLERGTPGSLPLGNCSSYAHLVLDVASNGSRDVGYRVQLVDGRLPDGFELPAGPVARDGEGQVLLYWNDMAVVQRPIDFTLALSPVNAAGVVGEAAEPVRVEGDADFTWFVFVLLAWPLMVFLRHASDRLPLDYYTVDLPDGGKARPEREWFVTPGRLGVWHDRAGLGLHVSLVLLVIGAALWWGGRFGVLTLFALAVALHVYLRRAVRVHRTPLPPARWFLRRMMRRRAGRADAPISIEAALARPAGARVHVRGRVRCARVAGAYRRHEVWADSARQIQEWQAPFELVDERGRVLAVDVTRLWVVAPPGARTRIDDGDEVTVTGVIERRRRGIGHGSHPYSGDLIEVTLAAPEGGALLLE